MTAEEITERISIINSEMSVLSSKLKALQSGSRRVDNSEMVKVDKLHDVYHKEWKLRRRMVIYSHFI